MESDLLRYSDQVILQNTETLYTKQLRNKLKILQYKLHEDSQLNLLKCHLHS